MNPKWIVALVVSGVAPIVIGAQAERLTLRWAPKPNQVLHTRVTYELTMGMTPSEPPAGVPSAPSMEMAMKMAMSETMDIGSPNDEGVTKAQLTIDDVTQEMTMNGQPMPSQAASPVTAGQRFTFTFDNQGKVADIEGMPAAIAGMVKQLIAGGMSSTPAVTLGIGETTTIPVTLSLPFLPTGGSPMSITGESSLTLASVVTEGTDRVAHLTIRSAIDFSNGQPSATLAMDMHIAGEGTMDLNLERGFTKASEHHYTIDGTMRMTPPNPRVPARGMGMKGTMKLSSVVE